jgi:hypothetical protein
MSFIYETTAGFMPRDIRSQRSPYLPRQKQKPYLEVPHGRHS